MSGLVTTSLQHGPNNGANSSSRLAAVQPKVSLPHPFHNDPLVALVEYLDSIKTASNTDSSNPSSNDMSKEQTNNPHTPLGVARSPHEHRPLNNKTIDQLLNVVATLYPNIFPGAMAILDSAPGGITQIVSKSTPHRTIMLVAASATGKKRKRSRSKGYYSTTTNTNTHHSPTHANAGAPTEGTHQASPLPPISRKGPSHYFCKVPLLENDDHNYGPLGQNSSEESIAISPNPPSLFSNPHNNLYFCSCRSFYDKNLRIPPNTAPPSHDHQEHQHRPVLCKHLLALLLLPSLDVTPARLEMRSEKDFTDLIVSRMGLW